MSAAQIAEWVTTFRDTAHRCRGPIPPALALLRIGIFWRSDDHEVTLHAPWDL
jgi:hypothetical protein